MSDLGLDTSAESQSSRRAIHVLLGAALGLAWFVVLFSAFLVWAYLVERSAGRLDGLTLLLLALKVGGATGWILPLLGGLAAYKWPLREAREADVAKVPAGTSSVVIMIHGTFAQRVDDRGDAWWQRGGVLAEAIDRLTSGKAPDQFEHLPFHWSGQNLETARRRAAERLCILVQGLEERERPYHLVGHSHGGSVLWQALVRNSNQGRRLDRLQTWTTVGSPFFQFRTPEPRLWQAAVLVVFTALATIGRHALLPMWRSTNSQWPVFFSFEQGLLLPLVVVDALLLLTGALGALLAFDLAWRLSGIWRNRSAESQESAAYELFRGRHLAVASSADEAINGLSVAQRLDPQVIRLVPSLPYFTKSLAGKLLSPLTFPWLGLWNAIMTLPVNLWVVGLVRNRIHGNDLRGAEVVKVSSAPGSESTAGSLFSEEEAELKKATAGAAGTTVGRVREALGAFAVGSPVSVLPGVSDSMALDALIHNSYFRQPTILSRIGSAIAGGATAPPHLGAGSAPGAIRPASRPRLSKSAVLPGVVLSLVLVGLWAGSRAVFQTAIEPRMTSSRLDALVERTNGLAGQARGEEALVWLAVRSAIGRWQWPPLDTSRDNSELLDEMLQMIRWKAARTVADRASRDRFFDEISGTVVDSLRRDVADTDPEATVKVRRRTDQLWSIVKALAGLRQIPDFLSEAGLTGPPRPVPPTPGSRALIEKIETLLRQLDGPSKLSPELRARIQYTAPMVRRRVTAAEMRVWDEGVPPAARLADKIELAEASACRMDLSSPGSALSHQELPVERFLRVSSASALWWGECAEHLAIARAALDSAAEEYRRGLPLTGLARTRLLARFWSAVAQVRGDGRAADGKADNGRLAKLESELQTEVERSIVSASNARDWHPVVPILEALHKLPAIRLSGETEAEVERSLEEHLALEPEATADLIRGCLALSRCQHLKESLLSAIAERPETPAAWDDVLVPFAGHFNFQVILAACRRSSHTPPCIRLKSLFRAWQMEDASREAGEYVVAAAATGRISEISADPLGYALGIYNVEPVLQQATKSERLGTKTASQLYLQMARGGAALGSFQSALRYSDSIVGYEERLLIASEILLRYERLRQVLPADDLEGH